jgi:putative ABC transport system permease protein
VIATQVIDAAVFGPIRNAPGRTLLAVLAIALGVALGLAIYLINRSAADEISMAARSLYGLADFAIEAGGQGFDEALYPRVARTPGVAVASPVVEVQAKLVGRRGALTLIGVDPYRTEQLQPAIATAAATLTVPEAATFDLLAVFLSSSAARELALQRGDRLEVQVGLQRLALNVAGVLPPAALEDRAGVIDIATAQWKLARLGFLSRINVRLHSGADPAQVRAALSKIMPAGAQLTTPGEATDDALRLSRAYRSNLTALALVALFTGGFFVYSTQALAALRRRREFAVLHAIGVTRGEQRNLMLAASALVGLLGAALGIGFGIAVARLGLRAFGGDLGAGYFRGLQPQLDVQAAEIVAFAVLGMLVAVTGALRPVLEAARVPTASALKAGDIKSGDVRTHGVAFVVLSIASALLLAVPPIGGLPIAGYVSIALLLIATVVATPSVVQFLMRRAPASSSAVTYQIAIAQIAGTARYATLSVASIIVSFSLMVSMAIMVTSFRTSLDAWTQRLLPADLYLRVGYVGQSSHLDETNVAALRALPGVERLESSRFARAQVPERQASVTLIARTLDPSRIEDALWLTSSAPQRARSLPNVWISEAAADRFNWRSGDTIDLTVSNRALRAFVAGVWRDYEHQSGAVILERSVYEALTGDHAVNTVWMWLDDAKSEREVSDSIGDALPPGTEYDLRTPGDLRRLSLQAFDRTFAITYLLELVAVLIGVFGIAAGVSAQVLARRGEFGALRHLGFTRGQIAAMLAIEGAVLGTIGVLIGLLTGGLVSLILIYVVNRQSFHWSMDVAVPSTLLAVLSVVLVAASALIAVSSGRQAMSGDVVRAVKEDW